MKYSQFLTKPHICIRMSCSGRILIVLYFSETETSSCTRVHCELNTLSMSCNVRRLFIKQEIHHTHGASCRKLSNRVTIISGGVHTRRITTVGYRVAYEWLMARTMSTITKTVRTVERSSKTAIDKSGHMNVPESARKCHEKFTTYLGSFIAVDLLDTLPYTT